MSGLRSSMVLTNLMTDSLRFRDLSNGLLYLNNKGLVTNTDPSATTFTVLPLNTSLTDLVTSYNNLLAVFASRQMFVNIVNPLPDVSIYFQTTTGIMFYEFPTGDFTSFPTDGSSNLLSFTYLEQISLPIQLTSIVNLFNQSATAAGVSLRMSNINNTMTIKVAPGYSFIFTDPIIYGSGTRFLNHVGLTNILPSYPTHTGFVGSFNPYSSVTGSTIVDPTGNQYPIPVQPNTPTVVAGSIDTSGFTVDISSSNISGVNQTGIYLDVSATGFHSRDIVPSSSTSYTFHGLSSGTEFQVAISYLTDYDEGQLSSASAIITTDPSFAPISGYFTQTIYDSFGSDPRSINFGQPPNYFDSTKYGSVTSHIRNIAMATQPGGYLVQYRNPGYDIYQSSFYISPDVTTNDVLLWIVSDDGCAINYTEYDSAGALVASTVNLITLWVQTAGAATGGPWFYPSDASQNGILLNWTAGNYYRFDCVSMNVANDTTFALYYSQPPSGGGFTYTTYPNYTMNNPSGALGTPVGIPSSWYYTTGIH